MTYKLAYLLEKYSLSRKINIAITYTHRAAEEIKDRLEELDINYDNVWVGTIHQFCLEFIIRPYTMYHDRLKKGYHIIDDYVKEKYIREIADELGIDIGYDDVDEFPEIIYRYQEKLNMEKEIDFDDILELSYEMIKNNRFIVESISNIVRSILVDEYQDTNELQYNILSCIIKSNKKIQVTFVGDTDQAIYGGLGGVAKTCDELKQEFEIEIFEKYLDGCYRSTQRIVDYYSNFRDSNFTIKATSDIKNEHGKLVYDNCIHKNDLYEKIAYIIKDEMSKGVSEKEICIIAPQWWLLFPFTKKIKEILPNVKFDAPDITPIKYDPMNIFYLISKLVFTTPGHKINIRKKIANEIIVILEEEYKIYLQSSIDGMKLLKIINSIRCSEEDGILYLSKMIEKIFKVLEIDLEIEESLKKAYIDFIDNISSRVKRYTLNTDVKTFIQCFKEKEGIVINTFHGVKGEEYTTVIAFGILNGYIPHWDTIIHKRNYREKEANQLLYVVCSRAKKNLYLFSERGHTTKKGKAYTPTDEIMSVDYKYDDV